LNIRVKNIIRVLVWGVLALYILTSIALSLPIVQKELASVAASSLSEILKTDVSVGHVNFDLFKRIIIEDVHLNDRNGQKMITVSRLSARYELLSLLEEKITINSIQLLGFSVHLNKETPESEPNIQFLLDAFSSNDSIQKESDINLRINSILIRRGSVCYDVLSKPETPGVFNPSHIGINDFEATVSVKALNCDSLNATIRRFSFNEKSGLKLKKLGGRLIANNKFMNIEDFTIQFPQTTINLEQTKINFDSLHHLPLMNKDVKYQGKLNASLCLSDFSSFIPQLKALNEPISLQSSFNGIGKDLHIPALSLNDKSHIRINGRASIKDWNAGRNLHLNARLTELSLNKEGLNYFIGNLAGKVPPIIEHMESFHFNGYTEGYLHNLRIHGEAKTTAGEVNTDIEVKTDINNNRTYSGTLSSNNLNLKKLLKQDKLGLAQFNVKIDGLDMKGRYPESYINGIISSIEYSGYQYQDITLDGIYKDGGFNGHLLLDDENGKVKIDGDFNLVQETPGFNLQASVSQFRPNKLKLSDKYIDSDISFHLNANFTGNSIDNINGSIHLDSLVMNAPEGKGYFLDSLRITAKQNSNEKTLNIDSPFMQTMIQGKYSYPTIPVSITRMLQKYLPSLLNSVPVNANNNDLRFDLQLSNTDFFSKLFYLPIELHMPVTLNGYINDTKGKMHVEGYFPKLTYNGTLYESGTLLFENLFNDFNCQLHGSMLMGSGAMLNLSVDAKAQNDQLKAKLNWGNNTDVTYTGQLGSIIRFAPSPIDSLQLQTDIEILPTTMVLSDSIWNIKTSHIGIEKGRIDIDNFKIERPGQHLLIDGSITKEDTDSCVISLKNIDVQYVLDIVQFDDVLFGGLATGTVNLKKLMDTPSINTRLNVQDFTVNNGLMGNADIEGLWDNELPGIRLNAQIAEGNISTTQVTGYVSPKLKALDLQIKANNTSMDLLEPYFDGIFSEVDGRIKGNVHLFGGFKSLDFTGAANVNMDAKLDALNTYFRIINDSIHIQQGEFALNNVRISDREGNTGNVNGALRHTHLKNMNYYFDIQSNNLLMYDTNENTDELFYGKVYGTGNITVDGGNNAMLVDVNITTGPNTTFTYINGTSSEATNNQFISFIDKTPKRIQDSIQTEFYHYTDAQKIQIDEGPSMDLRINMNIDANSNAQMKVIMDPIAGDNITARGNGNFQVDYYNKGDFRIFGHYTIDNGMYKLNMQEIIRKDFTLQQGSSVTFTGDPYQANLDVQAIHTVNSVSLSDLTNDVSQNKSTVKVNCIMNLTGSLSSPTLKFDLDLPSVNEEDQELIRSLVSTEEQMNTQIIYLLGIGKFYAYNYTDNSNRSDATSSLAFSTLSGQLNNILSQMTENKNWNIGANLSSGMDGWNGVEAEAILSGRLLNNRLLINGNFGYRENVMENTNFVGDFEAIWLLTPNGEFRIRGYNQTNDRYFFGSTLTTQGIGFIYKKDFNKWYELFQWAIRKRNKEKDKSKR